MDIFGRKGTPIVAPVTGQVVGLRRSDEGGAGRYIRIRRGAKMFHLAHLDTVVPGLKLGDTITAGTPVGTLGNSGSARGTQPHLHFSTFSGNHYRDSVDPFPYLLESLPK